eukprot:SAG11_NODE_5285_length_1606_cov_1.560053_2_plen_68_part_00
MVKVDWVGYGILIICPVLAIAFYFYQQYIFENWGVLAVAASVSIHYVAIMDPFKWTKKNAPEAKKKD